MMEYIADYFQKIFQANKYIKKDAVQQYDEVINGSYNVRRVLIHNNLCINGQALLGDDVTAKKNITVNGQFFSKKTTFHSDVTVNGNASLEDTKIDGSARFKGQVTAKHSLLNSVEILSHRSFFDNCKLNNLVVQALKSSSRVQRIYLTNDTEIAGDLIFNAGNREVHCDALSSVHGKIIGGKLIQKES